MEPDLAFVADKESSLPGLYWFLAGTIRSKSGLSLNIVHNLLKVIHQKLSTYPIPNESKSEILNFLQEGNAAQAKACLDSTLDSLKNSSKMLEFDLLRLIQEMRSDPLFTQSLQLQLQASPSFTCQLCMKGVFVEDVHILEDCPHSFHKSCISNHLSTKITSKEKKLICPAKGCSKEVSSNDLPALLSKELVKKFQDYSFEFGLQSGIYGKLVTCPACQEKFISEENQIICHKCGSNICGTCLKTTGLCTCHPVIFRRQCPRCSQWTEKNDEKFSVCLKCRFQFCFHCNSGAGACRCRT
jgi:hypothetical protein